jgi:hypothetical protein
MCAVVVDPFALPHLPGPSASRRSTASADSAASLGPARGYRRVVASGGELYGLAATRWCAVRCDVPVGRVVVSLGAAGLGADLYTERTVSVAACGPARGGHTCGDAAVAARVRVAAVGGRGLDDVHALVLDAAAARLFLGRVLVAAACENLTASRLGGSPTESRFGLGVSLLLPGSELRCAAASKGVGETCLIIGCEVKLGDWLRVRSGASVNPGRFAAGLGLGPVGVQGTPVVDLAWQWHPELGGSSVVSIESAW